MNEIILLLYQAERDLEGLKSHITNYGKENIAVVAKPESESSKGRTESLGEVEAVDHNKDSPKVFEGKGPEKNSIDNDQSNASQDQRRFTSQ